MIPSNDVAADRARVQADLEAGKSPEPMVFTMEPRVLYPSPVAAAAAVVQKEASGKPVRVRVIEPYRVSHQGKPFVGGQTVSVPAGTAEHWIKMKWVEKVPVSKKGKA